MEDKSLVYITSIITPTKFTIFIHYVTATCYSVPRPIIREIARAPYRVTAGGFEYGARQFSLMMWHTAKDRRYTLNVCNK